MRQIKESNLFKKDIKKLKKRGKDLAKLSFIVQQIALSNILPLKFYDHSLKGNWLGYRDCHIEPDWLLIYKLAENEVLLERTGTHSDIFR